MKVEFVTQNGSPFSNLSSKLAEVDNVTSFDRLDVATAYVSRKGVDLLLEAVGGPKEKSRWILGIDDGVSDPEAIDFVNSLVGAEVRLAAKGPSQRFHPKIYQLWSSCDAEKCVSYIGSSNLTSNGFGANVEAGILLIAESNDEVQAIRKQWQLMWELGYPITAEGLELYKQAFTSLNEAKKSLHAKASNEALAPNKILKLLEDSLPQSLFDGTPASATIAWLECGSASAGGLDLEFPAKMIPFFKLTRAKETRQFNISGLAFQLTFTYRSDNAMMRLLLSRDAVYSAIGRNNLRPLNGDTRSDLVIVFERTAESPNDFNISLLELSSDLVAELRKRSISNLSYSKTNGRGGREFGYI